MAPYFVMTIVWTIDGLHGGGLREGAWRHLNWAAMNGLTVAMSGLAMLLGLALAHRWGLRIPAWSTLLPGWIGMGFLVPMLPLLPFVALVNKDTGGTAPGAQLTAWEVGLSSISFGGFALGVAIAAPIYAVRRWPGAFAGKSVPGRPGVRVTVARLAAALCVALGAAAAVVAGFWIPVRLGVVERSRRMDLGGPPRSRSPHRRSSALPRHRRSG